MFKTEKFRKLFNLSRHPSCDHQVHLDYLFALQKTDRCKEVFCSPGFDVITGDLRLYTSHGHRKANWSQVSTLLQLFPTEIHGWFETPGKLTLMFLCLIDFQRDNCFWTQ